MMRAANFGKMPTGGGAAARSMALLQAMTPDAGPRRSPSVDRVIFCSVLGARGAGSPVVVSFKFGLVRPPWSATRSPSAGPWGGSTQKGSGGGRGDEIGNNAANPSARPRYRRDPSDQTYGRAHPKIATARGIP